MRGKAEADLRWWALTASKTAPGLSGWARGSSEERASFMRSVPVGVSIVLRLAGGH